MPVAGADLTAGLVGVILTGKTIQGASMFDAATTTLSSKGQVVIPKELREKFGWASGGHAIVTVTEDGLLIAPGAAYPVEIYTEERMAEFVAEEKKLEKFNLR